MKYNLKTPAPKKKKGLPNLFSKIKNIFKPSKIKSVFTEAPKPKKSTSQKADLKRQREIERENRRAEALRIREQRRLEKIADKLSKPGALDINPTDINEFEIWDEAERAQEKADKKAKQEAIEQGYVRHALERYSESEGYDEIELARKLNDALDIASDIQKNFPHGNGEYAKYLEPLMKALVGSDIDVVNPYYDLADYRGNKNFLYEYVRFEYLPVDNPKVLQYVQKILDLDWSSYENYADRYLEIKENIYDSNTSEITDIDIDMVSILEGIMNTSAAWHIAQRGANDSEQVKSNWVELFNIASDAYKWGLGDKVRQLIRNEVSLDEIDRQIYAAIKES